MRKRHFLVIIFLVLGLIGIEIYQYSKTFKEELVAAVTVGVPNPGHSLSSLECSADSLCIDTTNNRIGVGTNNPSTKLDVNGVLNLNANRITNVGAPTSSADAVTKEYVDAASSSGYSSCYILNSTTSGLSCATGFTTVFYMNSTCNLVWPNFTSAGCITDGSISVDGLLNMTVSAWQNTSPKTPSYLEDITSAYIKYAAFDTATCRPYIGTDWGVYLGIMLNINGQRIGSPVCCAASGGANSTCATYYAPSFAMCCK